MHHSTDAPTRPAADQHARVIGSRSEAMQLVAGFIETMALLIDVVEHETECVRAGKLAAANALSPRKSELSRRYFSDMAVLKSNAAALRQHIPHAIEDLKERHSAFNAALQMNLAVLATVHAVSESIVREVGSAVTATAAPSTYGASGRASKPAGAAAPIAFSRSL